MNGRTHAIIGCSLVPLSAVTGDLTLSDAGVLTAVAAGFALGPDIDHPTATISRAAPRFVHELFHGLSEVTVSLFRTKLDKSRMEFAAGKGIDTAHRTLTHTVLFSVAAGGLGYACAQNRFTLAALVLLSVLACRALLDKRPRVKADDDEECTDGATRRNPWGRSLLSGAALGLALISLFTHIPAEQVGLAAWGGWMSHIIADCCTKAGVPLLWPMKIKGRMWWRLRLLGSWLPSGDKKEWLAAVGVMAVMNLPYLPALAS